MNAGAAAEKAVEHRSPPNNLEAEQALLGALLVNNEAIHLVATFLEPDHFFLPVHGRIYAAVMNMVGRQEVANPVTLKTYFQDDEALKEAGGGQYLARLAGSAVTVNKASFQVHAGELLVIMGLSGSGKSTLLRCISRLTDATAGKIFVEGQDLLAMSSKQLLALRRSKMGMVFQSFGLLPHKTVLENIAFPLQMKGIGTRKSVSRARDMAQLVGLQGRENYFPRQLSGGQQQRVGIARSLAVEPDIWFLDEPFSALDPLIRKEMQDEFLRLQGVLNKTILFVTRDFDEALRLADRIAIMKDGIIEQLDTPAGIILEPATEYVCKFTEDVLRERVLRIESVMDPVDQEEELSDLRVSKDSIIETVAEAILNQDRPVGVVDAHNALVGSLHSSHVINVLFGNRSQRPSGR